MHRPFPFFALKKYQAKVQEKMRHIASVFYLCGRYTSIREGARKFAQIIDAKSILLSFFLFRVLLIFRRTQKMMTDHRKFTQQRSPEPLRILTHRKNWFSMIER